MYLRTLQPGDRILLNSTSPGFGGLSMPWTMWFDQVLLDGESSWENINPDPLVTVDAGGYVELGYQYGTIGAARAIY